MSGESHFFAIIRIYCAKHKINSIKQTRTTPVTAKILRNGVSHALECQNMYVCLFFIDAARFRGTGQFLQFKRRYVLECRKTAIF
jgi:hypothetical protein